MYQKISVSCFTTDNDEDVDRQMNGGIAQTNKNLELKTKINFFVVRMFLKEKISL